MSDPLDDVFDDALSRAKIDSYRAGIDTTYEDKIVKKFMDKVGLGGRVNELKELVRDRTGKSDKLSFALLREQFPDTTVWLKAVKIGHVYQTNLTHVFDNFGKSKIAAAWSEAYDEADHADANAETAVIFDFPGIKGVQMVVHNMGDPPSYGSAVFVATKCGDHVLYLEKFDTFLDRPRFK
jgi:hypothetical protein